MGQPITNSKNLDSQTINLTPH